MDKKNHTLNTTGVYVFPMGIEVHQIHYYDYFLEFSPNGQFSLMLFNIEKGKPMEANYSNLIEHGEEVGKGTYTINNGILHAEIVDHTIFKGTINSDSIDLEIKSHDYFLFDATYTFIAKPII